MLLFAVTIAKITRIEIDPDQIAGIRAIITRLRCQPAAREFIDENGGGPRAYRWYLGYM